MTPENSTARNYAFGPYEIVDTLGHGGMGVVYRAHDRNLGRSIALKILRDELRGESKVAARFQREAEAFARLDHPNIVHVYSVGMVDKIPYIAMELVEGETLADRMRREGALPWRDVLGYGAQIARALASAHDAQIIHRDIKPGNILVDISGRIRVTDFGIAKILNASTQLTTDGSRLGTPQYMCPERCQNQKVTPSSDIYSLGVVMFQAITGRLPYDARSNVELLSEISKGQPRRLREFVPDVPESVEHLIAYMLEKTPEKRPGSASALATSIGRVLEGGTLDEQAEELVQRLDDYRRSLPDAVTPDPNTPTRALEQRSLLERLQDAWYTRTRAERIGFAIIALASLIAAGGFLLNDLMTQPRSLAASLPIAQAARWDTAAPLIELRPETERVSIATLTLPDFTVESVSWTPDSRLLLLARGSGTRDTQWSLLELDPETGAALAAVPPFYSKAAPQPNVLAASSSGATLLGIGGGLRELTSGISGPGEPLPGRMLLNTDPSALSEAVRGASGSSARAVAHLDEQYDQWRISMIDESDFRLSGARSESGPEIIALSISELDGPIAYLRQHEEKEHVSQELWINRSDDKGGFRDTRVDEGALTLAPRGISSNGIVFSKRDTDGERIYAVADASDAAPKMFSAGAWPQWISTDRLCYHGQDRLGRTQLFIAAFDRPLDAQPLTHFEEGIAATGARLAPSGSHAAVPLPDGTAVAIIDLEAAAAL